MKPSVTRWLNGGPLFDQQKTVDTAGYKQDAAAQWPSCYSSRRKYGVSYPSLIHETHSLELYEVMALANRLP